MDEQEKRRQIEFEIYCASSKIVGQYYTLGIDDIKKTLDIMSKNVAKILNGTDMAKVRKEKMEEKRKLENEISELKNRIYNIDKDLI